MHADLERLIALQQLDSSIYAAERQLADEPARLAALDLRMDSTRQTVATIKERAAASQALRREIDKDIALHQGRLSKFRDQSMAVKTNQEYHAIQHEIAFAQTEIKKHEDRLLEQMMEADEIAAALKAAEAQLVATQQAVTAEKRDIAAEHDSLRQQVDALKGERLALVSAVSPQAQSIFDLVARRRNGIAIAEAKDGICTVCHVRLRPQVFNTVRRNEAVIQCDSCQRILYFSPATQATAPPTA